MARQPLTSLVAGVALLAACNTDVEWAGTFDVPESVDVLAIGANSPFEEPIGYAASLHGGRVAILSLRDRRYATDTATASFLRAAPLATGARRVIGDIAVYAPGDGVVSVIAADRAYSEVLVIPHVMAVADGVPVRAEVTVSGAEFVDADGSGDAVTIGELRALEGFAATEDWTLTYDGSSWQVRGSRSGRLELPATFGEAFEDDRGGIAFTLDGTATQGDQIVFTTDNGTVAYNVGGTPLVVSVAPDADRVAVIVATDAGDTLLRWMDPATGQITSDADLPADARPHRLAWSADGSRLWVADVGRPAVWEITPGDGDTITEHALPWPVLDVAPMDTENGRTLTVVPVDGGSVWVYDLDAGALRDLNALAPGINGIPFDSVVRAVEPIPAPFLWPQLDDDKVPMRGEAVAISVTAGSMVFLGDATGCLISDSLGPRTSASSTVLGPPDYETAFDGESGGAFLESNGSNNRSIIVNRCAGIAKTERWTLRYSAIEQAWVVEGTRSGIQRGLAYEDSRYVSDNGQVTFTIRSGTSPSADGWEMWFDTLPGTHLANGDNDGDGTRDVSFTLPGDPVWFFQDIATGDGGWREVEAQPFVLVPAAGADLIGKVNPVTGDIDAAYW